MNMNMIFPGMDPWLEDPNIWPEVHNSLIVYLRDEIQSKLLPRYVAKIESRVYLEGVDRSVVPDVSVRREKKPSKSGGIAVAVEKTTKIGLPILVRADLREVEEPYLTIRDLESNQKVVTVIEVGSPSNKHAGAGRDSYESKQREVLRSGTNLVEIDLLRAGKHVVAVPERLARARCERYEYLICVHRPTPRETFELYPLSVRDPLPKIFLPLAKEEKDLPFLLQPLLAKAYRAGAYRPTLRYDRPCKPPLAIADRGWAAGLLETAGLVKKSKRPKNQSP